MGHLNFTDWEAIAALAGSPACLLVLTFFVWKQTSEIKELKAAHEKLNDSIHNNGFLKRRDMDDAWKRADEIHNRQEKAIDSLRNDVNRLREELR